MIYSGISVYLIIVLLYFRLHEVEKNKMGKIIFAVFIPFFGIVAVMIAEILSKGKGEIIKENQIKNTSKKDEYLTNIQCAIKDCLAIKNYDKAREIILETKNLSLEDRCKICHIAIKSKNVEIAHISAVTLMRIQTYYEKFFEHIKNKDNKNSVEALRKNIDGIDKFLRCELAQGALEKKYRKDLSQVLESLIEIKPDCEEKYYFMVIENYIKLLNYNKAVEYVQNFIEMNGLNANIYKLALKIYYKMNDKEKFYELIKSIKSNPKMEREMKSVLGFWN